MINPQSQQVWAAPRRQLLRWTISYAPWNSPKTVVTEKTIAASQREALQSAMKLGVPLSAKRDWQFGWQKIDKDYRQQFLLALSFNVQSGMSAGKALEEVIQSERGHVRQVMEPALAIIKAGGEFSDAIDGLAMFDDATLSILRAGEKLGAMKEAMASAIAHIKKTNHSMKLMIGALMVIIADIVVSSITVFGVQFYQLPQLRTEGITSKDPVVVANFASNLDMAFLLNGILTAFTVVLSIVVTVVVMSYSNKEMREFRQKVDYALHQMPILRDLLRHTAISSTMSICGALLSGGVMLNKALVIVRGSTMSPIVSGYWQRAESHLEHGESVNIALQDENVLERSECLILASHADQMQLAQAMLAISERRDEMAERASSKFGKFAFWTGLLYSGCGVLIALWVSYIQYQAVMASTTSIGG
ncbi:type II secretion system protein (plasmid) [Rhodoferax ferrireducens T118]|uniref:Type II secretion system protein n=1 Tax=Albidiferax ferrireducens (strain ATCC BAA-621 / DSM 15236 / T118) TaxID=338969 RepID=Q21Q60_ALBFT|nr:type II secretion system F family protein [Rhodoferax ferrireducens]ABD72085.1 type II secretion system protein [Rhodoferax ferrireducens T118]